MRFVWKLCTRTKVEVLIHTRLQPGDRRCLEKVKPFKRFPDLRLALLTWLKARCESDRIGPKEFDSFRGPDDFCAKFN